MARAAAQVRSQAVIKLYVVFNLLEIADKLCASFGQDLLEILYAAVRRKRRWRGGLLLDFFIALCYITGHTLIIFYQVRVRRRVGLETGATRASCAVGGRLSAAPPAGGGSLVAAWRHPARHMAAACH